MLYATFVVPARNGCNLRCAGCAIAQRGEALHSALSHEDYVRFLSDILVHLKVGRVSIQGFEPLLPDAWPLTRQLLRLASAFLCETSLITNGVYLTEHAAELADLCDSMTVSIDSADPEVHDRHRGVQGAHAASCAGLRAATKLFSKGDVTVNSVLLPGKASRLEGMPELLSQLGVTKWLVSPFISFAKGRHLPHARYVRDTVLRLADEAAQLGIRVELSDELRALTDDADLFQKISVEALQQADDFFRLSPDASCSRGKEALGVSRLAPKWDANEPPHVFVKRIFAEDGRPLRERRWRWLAERVLRRANRTR